MNEKAVIAMSGGVDSSVAAALMLSRGYDCIGITLKLFNGGSRCCSLEDVNDARDVAYRLGMPHYVLNFIEDFKADVIERFIKIYEEGGTPNPCIDCNRSIKFEKLLHRARELEYGSIVTGHYARIERDAASGRYLLKKAVDEKKDQSYVLYCLTQDQLEHTFFPLGAMTKAEVREIALQRGFINAKKQDSQDICFVPDGNYGGFMEQYTGKSYPEGDIIDLNGNVIGRHKGIVRYTIGQRRGLGVACNEPVYVVRKNMDSNTVTMGLESSLYSKSLDAYGINLIACASIEKPLRVTVKTRYLQKEQWASAEQTGPGTIHIEFEEPQRAVTPGQAMVMYDGDIVVGGGTIGAQG